ncbi:MAG: hypothetical protein KGS00_05475 [Alphaproteobacteria bacterium]|nr:hypothetical protein [Alphaproteobacteria bacterium]
MSEGVAGRLLRPVGLTRSACAFAVSAALNLLLVWGLSVATAPRHAARLSAPLVVSLIATPFSKPAPAGSTAPSRVSSPSTAPRAGVTREAIRGVAAEGAPGVDLPADLPAVPTETTGEVPAGLRSLLAIDPCADTLERLRKDCRLKWAGAMAPGGGVAPQVLEELAEAFPGFKPEGVFCSLHLGCSASAQARNLNGTRPVDRVSPMASGAGGLGGPHDLVGRLPPPNPYHVDPGFGD